jgi:hypothetical protein
VTDADSYINTVQGWFAQQRAVKGGGATDAYDTPVQDTYRERRYQALNREEGVRQFAYDDKTGQQVLPGQPVKGYATVGIGFNMDAPASRATWSAALPFVDFDAVRSGKTALNDAQIQKLFDASVGGTERLVADKFQGVDLSEHQRLALISLGYQRPAAISEVAEAYHAGGLPSAIVSMLSQPGSQGRRLREVSQFLGAADAPPLVQPFVGGSGGSAAAVDDMKSFLGKPGWDSAIRDYIHTGGVNLDPATNAWCAMLVNSALEHHGLQGTGSQLASSFEHWGQPVDPGEVQKGDVLVAPGSGISGRHVGMATGNVRQGPDGLEIEMMAGNDQAHRAGARFHPASELVIRRAAEMVADATDPHETGGPGVVPSFAGRNPDTRGNANYPRPPLRPVPGSGSFSGKVG